MSRLSHLLKPPTASEGRRRAPVRPAKNTNTASNDNDISDILSKRYGGISVYFVVMVLMAIAIISTAIRTAEQIQTYHQDYSVLQDMKRKQRKLQVEYQRLLIEQQTFSATPQIANRAVTELGMFSPSTQDKLIIQPVASSTGQANPFISPTSAVATAVDEQPSVGGGL